MPIPSQENFVTLFEQRSTVINPPFPNWQKSFISGADSPLFEIEHRIFTENSKILISKVSFKNKAEGPPGYVHGGASAALIDETMGIVVWYNQYACVTQQLNLTYIKTLPLNDAAYVLTEITEILEDSVGVISTIYDHKKTPFVSAKGVFHQLTEGQLEKFKIQNKI